MRKPITIREKNLLVLGCDLVDSIKKADKSYLVQQTYHMKDAVEKWEDFVHGKQNWSTPPIRQSNRV